MELTTEQWKQQKKKQRAIFTARQNLPYDVKIRRQKLRAWEFWNEMENQDKDCHVSVGGLDSITLYIWLHSIGIHIPGLTVSGIEDRSIQRVHKALGLEIVKSYKSKVTILNEIGFPVISKKIAGRINTLQNPTEDRAPCNYYRRMRCTRTLCEKQPDAVATEMVETFRWI